MTDSLAKFQQLLRELFQFDCADLEFGIYQIMNYKRREVERFISDDLPQQVATALEHSALAEQSQAAQELHGVAAQIKETLGADALNADGSLLAAYHGTPLGKKYLDLKGRSAGSRGRESLEALIYNHLIAFFSHYYQDGDFISKRRYSTRREIYAIPYNGEEVTLYWANHDQYYIKTAEHFTDYTYTAANGATVHFKLQAADVEQNNVKGEKRFFLPRPAVITWDAVAAQLVIPFEFRPLTEQENISYGGKNQQEAILARALVEIPKRLSPVTAAPALAALTAEQRVTADGEPVTTLAHHLRQYTRRNTSDFFIHKDLKGFLTRELDFYLKNEVLSLDDMEAAGEGRAEGWFQIMGAIRAVGCRIIEFLAQVEEFQKLLWEKRKFITETFYCITVGAIPEAFYAEIARCDAQWDEWKALFQVDEEHADLLTTDTGAQARRIAFLQAHSTLVLDTRYFDQPFVDRLLGSFDDPSTGSGRGLDEMTDGLLLHSENWQALNSLVERYRGKVECTYIDPPYNTDASSIIYKNDYKHSSWMSLFESRLAVASHLLANTAILCTAIDDEEFSKARHLLGQVLAKEVGVAVVRSNPQSRKAKGTFSPTHEYALFYGKSPDSQPGSLELTEKRLARYPKQDEKGRFAWMNFIRTGSGDKRADRPKLYYPIYVADDNTLRVPEMTWSSETGEYGEYVVHEAPKENERAVFPVIETDEGRIEKRWHRGRDRISLEPDDYRARRDSSGNISIDFKTRMDEDSTPMTWWDNNEYASANYGAVELKALFGTKPFDFPKALALVTDCLRAANATADSVILDYFAGSGTTGHAVINLNREDGGRRKFILVEMADYFDTVLLPRIKKVSFTPEWKEGKPKRMATAEEVERGPRIIKAIRLESYEDSLNNIVFDEASGQQAIEFDDYLLRYMLKWEARRCETLLNIEKLASPFRYSLHIHADGQTSVKPVDIPETFNYLLGLHVQTRRVYHFPSPGGRGAGGEGRYVVYRGRIDQRQVAVIWRETEGWGQADYERDRLFVTEQKFVEGADEVFVNGDSFIPGARALEPLFKARMFASVEA